MEVVVEGIPGAHLDVDNPRDREDDGVLIAPVDAARREAGGRESPPSYTSGCKGSGSKGPQHRWFQ